MTSPAYASQPVDALAKRPRTHRGRASDIAAYAVYAIVGTFFVVPLLWLVSLSLRDSDEIFVSSIRLLPQHPTLANFVQVLQNQQFPIYLWNGLKLALAGAGGAAVFAAPAAYAFSRFRFRGRRLMLVGLLAFQMISPLVIMIPLYRYLDSLGLTESHFGAAIIYVVIAVPLFTWMLKSFFDGIPRSLEEAAIIDGCTRFGAFVRIVLPLSLPGLSSAFTLTAIMGWSQFIVPFVLLSKPSLLPISVGIYNFQGTYAASSTQLVAAASLIALLPAIVVFLIFQRFVIGALTAGAVKG